MPTPISSSVTPAATPDPETAPVGPPPPPPKVVPIDPVYIEGDAGSQELVKRHAAATAAPNCHEQGVGAAVATVPIGAAVLGTLAAAAAGPLGIAGCLLGIFGASIYEGKELRALHDCKTK